MSRTELVGLRLADVDGHKPKRLAMDVTHANFDVAYIEADNLGAPKRAIEADNEKGDTGDGCRRKSRAILALLARYEALEPAPAEFALPLRRARVGAFDALHQIRVLLQLVPRMWGSKYRPDARARLPH